MPSVQTLLYLIGALCVIICAEFFYINHLSGKIDKLTGELAVSQANESTLKSRVAQQNTAIDAMRAQADADKSAADARAARAAQTGTQKRKDAAAIKGAGQAVMNEFMQGLYE